MKNYKIYDTRLDGTLTEAKLEDLYQAGWELVSSCGGYLEHKIHYFKRRNIECYTKLDLKTAYMDGSFDEMIATGAKHNMDVALWVEKKSRRLL